MIPVQSINDLFKDSPVLDSISDIDINSDATYLLRYNKTSSDTKHLAVYVIESGIGTINGAFVWDVDDSYYNIQCVKLI